MSSPTPPVVDSEEIGLFASTSDARVLELMDAEYRLDQEEGQQTMTPADDVQFITDRL